MERQSTKQRMHQTLTVHRHTLSDGPRGGKYGETLSRLTSSREVLRQTVEETWKLNQFPYLNPLTRMLRAHYFLNFFLYPFYCYLGFNKFSFYLSSKKK